MPLIWILGLAANDILGKLVFLLTTGQQQLNSLDLNIPMIGNRRL